MLGCFLPPPCGEVETRERFGWGAVEAEGGADGGVYAVQIGYHIIVPETQHLIALCFEPCGAALIGCDAFGFIMLAAIDFDDEFEGVADEVGNVRAYRCLTSEVEAGMFEVA